MFRSLRVKSRPEKIEPLPGGLSAEWFSADSSAPVRLAQLNALPEKTRQRIYRFLIPPHLLAGYEIDPLTWKGSDDAQRVNLSTNAESGTVHLSATLTGDSQDQFFELEIADNAFGGVDLNFLVLSDPESERFSTDVDEQGKLTLFGTLRRNLSAEERAMQAGLAPGQVRHSLGASRLVLQQLDAFLAVLGQRALFLEPLSYASAWVFERRGFAYVRGHKLMDDIQREFQPGGRLHAALDGSTPFRQPGQWNSVRGRAWAIHDGILKLIDARWDKLRMIHQVGRNAGVETYPNAVY
jgi:hypothetical protein